MIELIKDSAKSKNNADFTHQPCLICINYCLLYRAKLILRHIKNKIPGTGLILMKDLLIGYDVTSESWGEKASVTKNLMLRHFRSLQTLWICRNLEPEQCGNRTRHSPSRQWKTLSSGFVSGCFHRCFIPVLSSDLHEYFCLCSPHLAPNIKENPEKIIKNLQSRQHWVQHQVHEAHFVQTSNKHLKTKSSVTFKTKS